MKKMKGKAARLARWYFLPEGNPFVCALRSGLLYWTPLFFLSTRWSDFVQGNIFEHLSFESIVANLVVGILAGFGTIGIRGRLERDPPPK